MRIYLKVIRLKNKFNSDSNVTNDNTYRLLVNVIDQAFKDGLKLVSCRGGSI